MRREMQHDLAGFVFLGDPRLAKQFVSTARKLLAGHLDTMTDRGITLARHRFHLAGGLTIEIKSNGGAHSVIIDVRSLAKPASAFPAPLLVYEFAAQNPFPESRAIKWFRLFFTGSAKKPWRAEVRADFQKQALPHDKSDSEQGVVCSPVGGVTHCGASKLDHITWHGPAIAPGGHRVLALRGAGDMVHVDYHANRYCNYQVETGIDGVYWYGTTGRGGLGGENNGATTPVAEGITYVDHGGRPTKVIVSVAPSGKVTVTRPDTRQSSSGEPDLPGWTKANEMGRGFAFGVWKLNSTCTRAVSVLHGNPWVFEAYGPAFDISRLLTDPDPAIGGAFQSAVFELRFELWIGNSGTPYVYVTHEMIRPVTAVRTCGLAYGSPEKHSEGEYWFAADYGVNDEVLTACILYERRETFAVAYDAHPPSPATPYANIEEVSVLDDALDEPDIDPCGAGTVWGITKKYSRVIWWTSDYSFTRTKTAHTRIVLQCTGMPDIALESSRVTDELRCEWGSAGGGHAWLWSNGASGSYDVAGYVMAVAKGTYTPCARWSVRSSGFTSPTSLGAGGQRYRYRRNTRREPTVKRALLGLDLRVKTLFYSEQKTEWTGDGTGDGWLQTGVGWQTWQGSYLDSGSNVTHGAGILSANPALRAETVTRTDAVAPPAPQTHVWAEFYDENYSDAALYPLVTKLWHQMVLGKPNPKTPATGGGFIGPLAHWSDYYPYQMIALAADSLNAHPPLGLHALRFAPAAVDLIRYVAPDGALFETSHAEVIAIAKLADEKAAAAENREPHLTDAELALLGRQALTTRGEWTVAGPVRAFAGASK